MGCSLNRETPCNTPEQNLDVYLVRKPLTPVEESKSYSKISTGDLSRQPQRKWIRSVSVMDTRCSLTTREKFQIIKSWKGISRDITSTGINMFLRMFETNQDVRNLFSFGVYTDPSELRENPVFVNHVTMVMHTLDEAISSLGDIEYVADMLKGIGKSHRHIPGFNFFTFNKIEDAFLMSVKETLDDRYSVNIDNIYRKTIKFIIREIQQGFGDSS